MSLNDLHTPPRRSAEQPHEATARWRRRAVRIAIFFALGLVGRLIWVTVDLDNTGQQSQAPTRTQQAVLAPFVGVPDAVGPSYTVVPEPTIKLTAPDRLGTLRTLKGTAATALAAQIEKDLRAAADGEIELEQITFGVYGSTDKPRAFGAIMGEFPNPGLFLQTRVLSLSSWGLTTVGPFEHIYGSALGGVMQCADGKRNGKATAICLWGDPRTFGIVLFTGEKAADIRKDFSGAREQIEVLA